jgi:hypothetical protein
MSKKVSPEKRVRWFWTKEEIALVLKLSVEGNTCSEIANTLGGKRTFYSVREILTRLQVERKLSKRAPYKSKSQRNNASQYERNLDRTQRTYVTSPRTAPLAYHNGVYRGK